MAGILYCFNTIESADIYKVGYTQQNLAVRMRGYLGPSKPRCMVLSRNVDNVVQAESIMLQLLRFSNILRARNDLGKEWFQACQCDVEARHKALVWLADIVQRAVQDHATVISRPKTTVCLNKELPDTASEGQGLPGMETYFRAFDNYVSQCKIDTNIEKTLQHFEQSDWCPIFADFTRFSFTERATEACRRHPLLDERPRPERLCCE